MFWKCWSLELTEAYMAVPEKLECGEFEDLKFGGAQIFGTNPFGEPMDHEQTKWTNTEATHWFGGAEQIVQPLLHKKHQVGWL